MSGKSFNMNRLFAQAYANKEREQTHVNYRKSKKEEEDEEEPVDPTEPQRVLSAFSKKDYFACLSLPGVTLDDVGRPVWAVTDNELSRAFRKGSLRVHPDKNPAPDAREAFGALKEAQKVLQDPSKRADAIKAAGEAELQRLHKEDPGAIRKINKNKEVVAAAEYTAEVRAQAERQKEKAAEQRELAGRRGKREASDSDSDEEEWKGPAVKKGRGRGGPLRYT